MAPPTRKMLRSLALWIALTGLVAAGSSLVASAAFADASACPKLTQTKYPFLTCEPNAYGGVTLRMPGYTPPLACHQRMPDGDCTAAPKIWQLPVPKWGPSE